MQFFETLHQALRGAYIGAGRRASSSAPPRSRVPCRVHAAAIALRPLGDWGRAWLEPVGEMSRGRGREQVQEAGDYPLWLLSLAEPGMLHSWLEWDRSGFGPPNLGWPRTEAAAGGSPLPASVPCRGLQGVPHWPGSSSHICPMI